VVGIRCNTALKCFKRLAGSSCSEESAGGG
jgi:hypothetical protein